MTRDEPISKGISRAGSEDKRAAALRENLKKRKSQATERRVTENKENNVKTETRP
jgi:hypothetical protein